MPAATARWLCALSALLPALTLGAHPTRAMQDPAPAASPPEFTATAPAWTDPPLSRRPYPAGVDDEPRYAAWLADRAALMARDAEGADDAAVKVERLLSAANFILSRQIEPAATRWLLQIARPDDGATLAAGTTAALALLDRAATLLQDLRPSDALRTERIEEFERTLRTLAAFARAVGAVPQSGSRRAEPRTEGSTGESQPADAEDDAPRRARRKAAAGLAVCLEDDRPAVAASAVLWQGVLYGLTDDLDRAMTLLPYSARTVSRAAAGSELFARMQRCRYVAQRGGEAAASGLLLNLEEQCLEGFANDPRKDEAARAVALVRIQTLEHWRQSLPPAAETERAWCRITADAVRREQFGDADGPALDRTVMRLEEAVPLIFPKGAAPAVPTTAPAPKRAEADEPR